MGYDGKIKNGLILKKSEEGLFLRTIKKSNWKNEAWYKLSYDEQEHKYFDKEFLLEYLNENYLNDKNKSIDEINLSNDLITLKTYRDHIEQIANNQDNFNKILDIVMSVTTTMLTVTMSISQSKLPQDASLKQRFETIPYGYILILMFLVACSAFYNILIFNPDYNSYKVQYINNVIYTLETIKEDMDKTENLHAKYKATRNKYSPRAMYERKRR
jgi:hypothetical protein